MKIVLTFFLFLDTLDRNEDDSRIVQDTKSVWKQEKQQNPLNSAGGSNCSIFFSALSKGSVWKQKKRQNPLQLRNITDAEHQITFYKNLDVQINLYLYLYLRCVFGQWYWLVQWEPLS